MFVNFLHHEDVKRKDINAGDAATSTSSKSVSLIKTEKGNGDVYRILLASMLGVK